MYNSGVRILPDTSQFDQAINRMGQVNAGLLQQEYADKKQQIDEFKAIIDKSFHPVFGKDREDYLKIQEDFLKKTADRYKTNQGRLTAKDYTDINNDLRNVEEYVALYKGAKEAMTKAVFDVSTSRDDRVDKQKSLAALKEISNMRLNERYEALNNGSWLSIKQKPFDAAKHVKDNFAPAYATDFEQRSGKAGTIVNVNTTSSNEDKVNEIAISNWNGNIDDVRDHFGSYDDYLADVKSRMKLRTEKGSATRIGGTSGSGTGGKKQIEIPATKMPGGGYRWEAESLGGKKQITITQNMPLIYPDGGNVDSENKNEFSGEIIAYEDHNFGDGLKRYAVVKTAVGPAENEFKIIDTPSDPNVPKDVRRDKGIYLLPMETLPKDWLKAAGIILKPFEEGDEVNSGSTDLFDGVNWDVFE